MKSAQGINQLYEFCCEKDWFCDPILTNLSEEAMITTQLLLLADLCVSFENMMSLLLGYFDLGIFCLLFMRAEDGLGSPPPTHTHTLCHHSHHNTPHPCLELSFNLGFVGTGCFHDCSYCS